MQKAIAFCMGVEALRKLAHQLKVDLDTLVP